ncbi:MAG TPA: glycosyl hydrolase [Ktedonobacterales bacterium]|nr:glycosyl hydrolase [Ktedonobacterales bacterium]
MTIIYMPMKDGLAVLQRQGSQWQATLQMQGADCWDLEVDPLAHEVAYCATLGRGLWQTTDGGQTWGAVGAGIGSDLVWSCAVSRAERVGGAGVVYAGTELSALWRSEDRGATWRELAALREIPSHDKWSYPPKPKTHHVRCILPDPNQPGRLFAGIEQGGVMRSLDGGETWEDHNPQAQNDPHTLAATINAPGRIYESGGGGYRESYDGGNTWQTPDTGMKHHYLFGLAIDPGDPDTVIVSNSANFATAHFPVITISHVYRKSGGSVWEEVHTGLPRPRGQSVFELGANEAEPGVFYLGTRTGELYRSADKGLTWERQDVVWPNSYKPTEIHHLVATEV